MPPAVLWREDELGVPQVVRIVDLGPKFSVQGYGMNLSLLHIDEYAEDQLIITVVVDNAVVVAEQSAKSRTAELGGKLLDVECLVLVGEVEV
jgi:hypothetical protein